MALGQVSTLVGESAETVAGKHEDRYTSIVDLSHELGNALAFGVANPGSLEREIHVLASWTMYREGDLGPQVTLHLFIGRGPEIGLPYTDASVILAKSYRV